MSTTHCHSVNQKMEMSITRLSTLVRHLFFFSFFLVYPSPYLFLSYSLSLSDGISSSPPFSLSHHPHRHQVMTDPSTTTTTSSHYSSSRWSLIERMVGYPYLTPAHLQGFDHYKVRPVFAATRGDDVAR